MPEYVDDEGESLEESVPNQRLTAHGFPNFPFPPPVREHANIEEVLPEAFPIPNPNWEMWRTRGACRIWKAVLISMGIKPTTVVRARLEEEQPERYEEFLRRKKDVGAQLGLHPELRAVQHPNAGEQVGDQYIMLRNLLNFAKEHRWEGLESFEKGMQFPAAEPIGASRAHLSFDALPQGHRHAMVRTGALLQLLENILSKSTEVNAEALLRGGKLNISEVAFQVEKIIGAVAGQEKLENFEKEANRKQLGDAQRALRAHF
ncbi:hypothetical protein [Comamonas testosteroni]|uniref:hypothetical protein n=1 Tax=Comamonas testosteroni TaxID=285 RepID=UPI0011470D9A|nr:hypothetical protein [Comamonas testosteroni]